MFLYLLLAVLGAALVLVGADRLTEGSVGLARRFSVPEMVIGLTVVAFGTSLPEFIVSLLSSIEGVPSMSIGNVVGSNLFNTLMIVGITAIVSPIVVPRSTVAKDIPFVILSSVVVMALAMDGIVSGVDNGQVGCVVPDVLDRGDGVALLSFFAIFMFYTFTLARQSSQAASSADTEEVAPLSGWRIAFYLLIGIAGLIGGGELFVLGASGVARALGVSEAVIGLTLVAGGTSLPELATSVMAARKGQSGIAIGNVIGSNLFNVLWILGTCACVAPLPVAGIAWTDFAMLLFSALLFWLFSRTRLLIQRWEGVVMVGCYVAYIAYLLSNL